MQTSRCDDCVHCVTYVDFNNKWQIGCGIGCWDTDEGSDKEAVGHNPIWDDCEEYEKK